MNISFAGCGFLGIYHVGVASCFRKHAPHIIDKISGASAGALVGLLLVCEEIDLGQVTEDILKTAAKARARSLGPLHPGFNIVQILRDGMERVLPEDLHRRASGKLHISLTRVSDRQNVMASEFTSKQDVIDALVCSTFIPFYSGFLPPSFRGTRYVDGGISDNLPIIDPSCKTITVSPFSGEADICPRSDEFSDYLDFTVSNTHIQLTASNLYRMCRALYPPEPSVLSRMCQQGFDDALVYLKTHTIIPCERHKLKARSHSVCLGNLRMGTSPSRSKLAAGRRRTAPLPRRCSHASFSSSSSVRWSVSEDSGTDEDAEEEEEEEEEEEHAKVSDGLDETDFEEPSTFCVLEEKEDEVEEEEGVRTWDHWDDDDFFENRPCEKCEHHSKELRRVKSLPPEVIEVLHSACQSLNPTIWNYITRSRLGQVVSIVSLPYILPLETAFTLAMRLTRWLPHLPADMKWFLTGLSNIIRIILSTLGDIDIRKFEAQFSCNFGFQLEPEHMSALAGYPAAPPPVSDHAHELLALDMATRGGRRPHKLNFQFSMDVQAETLPDCVMDTFDFCDDLSELTLPRRRHIHVGARGPPRSPTPTRDAPCTPEDQEWECDSYEYTLKVAEEIEDVTTYHYLRVTQQVEPGDGRGTVEVVEV